MGASTDIARRPSPGASRPREGALSVVLQIALALVVTGAAMVSGFNLVEGDKRLAVLPIVAVAAIGLGVLAMTRFGGFALLILAVRPSLDLLKLSSSETGTTVGNTATARGLDPSSIVGVLFLLAAIIWLTGRIRSGTFIRGSRLQLAMACFIGACVISVLGSSHPQASGLECLRIGTVLMMFIVLNQLITSRAMMIRVIVTCYVGLLYPLAYTTFGLLTGAPASEVKGSFTRLTGPFSQSNTFSRYLAFLVVFGIAIYPHVKPSLKAVFAALLGISTLFMVLTLTRTAIIGMVVGLVVLAVVQRRRGLAVGLIVVAAAAMFAIPGVGARFGNLDATATPTGAPTGNTLVWRLNYWTEVLPLANHNPVTGIGLNGTQYETDVAKQPHNDFVRAYVETGLLGFFTYVSMLIALVGNGRRAAGRATRGTLEHAVGAGSMAVSISFVLGSLAANVMSNVVSLFSLVAFAACASYVSRTAASEEAGEAPGQGVAGGPVPVGAPGA